MRVQNELNLQYYGEFWGMYLDEMWAFLQRGQLASQTRVTKD